MEELNKSLKLWRERFDERIYTLDNRESEHLINQKLLFCFSTIEKLLSASNQKESNKATNGLILDSNEYNEAFVLAIKKNEEKQWFKDLKLCSVYCTTIKSTISDIFEIKNRYAKEVFELRYENSKLKKELQEYKRNKH